MVIQSDVRHSKNADDRDQSMKRLTIDVPAKLHARIKSQCALKGVNMADERSMEVR